MNEKKNEDTICRNKRFNLLLEIYNQSNSNIKKLLLIKSYY